MARSSRALTRAHLETFLLENSFESKFYVEYGGYLTNHLAHAAIALFHLRAPLEHLEGFAAAYVRKLEPPNGTAAKAQCEVWLFGTSRYDIHIIFGFFDTPLSAFGTDL